MKQDIKREIQKIIGDIECPKKFRCCTSGFDHICEARDIGIESYLECLEKNPQSCKFSFSFGLMHLCQCPLRFYIAKKLKK